MMMAIDLFCGLGGWAEGFLAEGYEVIGFDIERHDYGTGGYPGQLVIQDVLTLHGSQFRDATVIVASPPCQAYSYRAMPWKRAKALPPPSNELFEACFRIQREASEAAGRHIPMVVENVRGAQPWVGRAKWHYGSYYLWGDVPALMPPISRMPMKLGVAHRSNGETNCHGYKSSGLNWSDQTRRGQNFTRVAGQQAVKNAGSGTWFAIGSPGQKQTGGNPVNGVKQHGSGREWFAGEGKISLLTSSHSITRKAASAMIAKIPFPLAQHIAKVFKEQGS